MRVRNWSFTYSFLLVVASALGACDGGSSTDDPDAGPPRGVLGVPDPTHGPPSDSDIDGDGVPNDADNCPSLANADQRMICEYQFPPRVTGDPVEDGINRINYWRRQLGLSPVQVSEELSEGCRLHIDYLEKLSAEVGMPVLVYEQDPTRPYATEEGAEAARGSLLAMGEASIVEAVDRWMNMLFHRLPLIHPGFTTAGVAYSSTGRYSCVHFVPGTNPETRAPHAILWPPGDIEKTARQYPGTEGPCPTADDPTAGGPCPPSAAIATLGIHGWGDISDVEGTITRLDTEEEMPLIHVFHGGGPSELEEQYFDGIIALVPEPNTIYARAPYEVRIDAVLDGEETTWRWRFHTQKGFNDDVPCELWDQGSFETAIAVTPAEIEGKICEQSDFFRLRNAGMFRVTLDYDPERSDLDLFVYDDARTLVQQATGPEHPHQIEVPGMTYLEVRGPSGVESPYVLTIEAVQ